MRLDLRQQVDTNSKEDVTILLSVRLIKVVGLLIGYKQELYIVGEEIFRLSLSLWIVCVDHLVKEISKGHIVELSVLFILDDYTTSIWEHDLLTWKICLKVTIVFINTISGFLAENLRVVLREN